MQKINLTHRGPQVIECIDLFDEARYGADKLFFRKRCETFADVIDQVTVALGGYPTDIENYKASELAELQSQKEEEENAEVRDEEKINTLTTQITEIETERANKKSKFVNLVSEMGVGNPLTQETSETEITVPIIALNRYHIPNKKFWNNTPPSDVENPYKASAAVKFSIRVHFRDDFAYIDFGCPWELTAEYGTGSLDENSKADVFIENFVLLQCHFISKEDALQILDSIFSNTSTNTAAYAMMRNAPQIVTETTELVDEDGTIIAL